MLSINEKDFSFKKVINDNGILYCDLCENKLNNGIELCGSYFKSSDDVDNKNRTETTMKICKNCLNKEAKKRLLAQKCFASIFIIMGILMLLAIIYRMIKYNEVVVDGIMLAAIGIIFVIVGLIVWKRKRYIIDSEDLSDDIIVRRYNKILFSGAEPLIKVTLTKRTDRFLRHFSAGYIYITTKPNIKGSNEADELASLTMEGDIQLSDEEKEIRHKYNNDLKSLGRKEAELQQAERYREALMYRRILTEAAPRRASLWALCALLLSKMSISAMAKAMKETKRLILEDKFTIENIHPIAEAYMGEPLENLRCGIQYANRALELHPKLELAWHCKGLCLGHIGIAAQDEAVVQRGLDCLKKALSINPGSPAKNAMLQYETALKKMQDVS